MLNAASTGVLLLLCLVLFAATDADASQRSSAKHNTSSLWKTLKGKIYFFLFKVNKSG